MSHGPGRTLPSSTSTEVGFLREDATAQTGAEWVTAAEVLQALTQINAAAEAAQSLTTTGLPSAITQSATAKPGGVYFINGAVTLTLPSASTSAAVAGKSNRQITALNAGTFSAVVAGTINGSTNSTLGSQYAKETYDTNGTAWFKVG